MAAPKLLEKQRLKLIEEYLSGIPIWQLVNKYHISEFSVRSLLKRRKIPKVEQTRRKSKYTLNEFYFDKIDNPHKAYWLGFLYADGYNYETEGVVRLSLQSKDKGILEKLLVDVNSNAPLFFRNLSKPDNNLQNCYVASLHSQRISKSLSKLGCGQKKSLILKIPDKNPIPKSLFRHFLRGLWDGDGNYYLDKFKNKGGGYYYRIRCMLCGSDFLMSQIKDFIESKFDINCIITKKGKVSILRICSMKSSYQFIKYLYHNSDIHLERKHQQIISYMDIINDSYSRRVKKDIESKK